MPQSTVPGEKTAATQPFQTKPAPFEIQGVREEDLIDLTPELKRQALTLIERFKYGPLYTPPSEFGTITMPSVGGGANWAGGAWDPETGTYYVTTLRMPSVITLFKPSRVTSNDTYAGRFTFLFGPRTCRSSSRRGRASSPST